MALKSSNSDHQFGPLSAYLGCSEMGVCRTDVFVRERTEPDVLEALREGRTIVYDRERVFGDPRLIRLAAADGRLSLVALAGDEHDLKEFVQRDVRRARFACMDTQLRRCGGAWVGPSLTQSAAFVEIQRELNLSRCRHTLMLS